MSAPVDPGPQKTGQQLRVEIIEAVTAGIAASGIPDGWTLPMGQAWDPDTKEFLGASCSVAQTGTRRERFQVDLHHAPVGDPLAFADMMGDYWKDQGYIVSPVGTPATGPGGRNYTENRADRADGSLAAGATAQDTLFVLSFYSECSTDPSLDRFAGPAGYREFDMLDPNPYYPTSSPTITPYPDH